MAVDKMVFGTDIYVKDFSRENYRLIQDGNAIAYIADIVNGQITGVKLPSGEYNYIPHRIRLIAEVRLGTTDCYVFTGFNIASQSRANLIFYLAPKDKCKIVKNTNVVVNNQMGIGLVDADGNEIQTGTKYYENGQWYIVIPKNYQYVGLRTNPINGTKNVIVKQVEGYGPTTMQGVQDSVDIY